MFLESTTLKANDSFMWDFNFALHWMPTRQALDFDEWLRIPIHDRPLFARKTKEYFQAVEEIAPDESESNIKERFWSLLHSLENSGEDVSRLMLWFASISAGNESLGIKPKACKIWIATLKQWAREDTFNLRCSLLDINECFSTCYDANVFAPGRILFSKKNDAQSWCENFSTCSDFDNYINSVYYSKLTRGYPASFFYFDIERRLHREWWRSVREFLTEDQLVGLKNELLDTLVSKGDADLVDWESTIRIDDAFTIELIPRFDSVARDW